MLSSVRRRWLAYNQISGAGTQISVEETRYDQKSGQQRAQISVQGGDRRISGGLGYRYLRACQPDTWTTRPTQISGPYLTTESNRYPHPDDQISAPRPDKQISPTALPDIPHFAKQIIRHPHSRISGGTPMHRYLVVKRQSRGGYLSPSKNN